MGIKPQTTEEYKERVYRKHGDSVEILSEYVSGTDPIDIVYHCSIHGSTYKTLNAKNVLVKRFSPCKKCVSIVQSDKGLGISKVDNKKFYYNRLKDYCESKGGKLISTEWLTAKTTYEVDCGNPNHPNFFSTADSLVNKPQWCPYCSGRKGNFQEEIESIVKNKNGEVLSDYTTSYEYVKVKCFKHNYTWDMMPMNIKKGRWCPICSSPYSEKVVYDYLITNGFTVRVQFGFDDLIGNNNEKLRFDLAILDDYGELVGIIEVDDDEHRHNHTQLRRVKARERDERKNTYCLTNNIKLFRLQYYNKRDEFKSYDWYYNYIHNELQSFLNNIKIKH